MGVGGCPLTRFRVTLLALALLITLAITNLSVLSTTRPVSSSRNLGTNSLDQASSPRAHSIKRTTTTTATTTTTSKPEDDTQPAVVVLLVMRTTFDPQRTNERAQGIIDTWGSEKRAGIFQLEVRFIVGSQENEQETGFPPHPNQVYVVDQCEGKTQKKTCLLFGALERAHNDFGNALAYVIKGDDVTFWFPSNLAKYLVASSPTFAGNLLSTTKHARDSFLSGGAGFVLSAAASRTASAAWKATCSTVHRSLNEDVALAKCLSNSKITGQDAVDDRGPLFNAYGPVRAISNDLDNWYLSYKHNVKRSQGSAGNGSGSNSPCCSSKLITFHYVEAGLARLLWKGAGRSLDDVGLDDWPTDLGGYSRKPDLSQLRALQEIFREMHAG